MCARTSNPPCALRNKKQRVTAGFNRSRKKLSSAFSRALMEMLSPAGGGISLLSKRLTMRMGIAIGDVTGVGPEVALKAVAAEAKTDDAQYVFIGDENLLQRLNQKLALRL